MGQVEILESPDDHQSPVVSTALVLEPSNEIPIFRDDQPAVLTWSARQISYFSESVVGKIAEFDFR